VTTDKIKDIFNQIYLSIHSLEYHFGNKRVEKQIETFISHAPNSAGEDWLYDFIVFQFSHYDGQRSRFDRIHINWILGAKALKRYKERTEEQVYYANQFKQKIGVRKDFVKLSAKKYLEKERKRFDTEARQIIHCRDLALFSDESALCHDCLFHLSCKNYEL